MDNKKLEKDIKHQMGRIIKSLMRDGKTSAKDIQDLVGSTTPSRRISDLREIFGKENLPGKTNRFGYKEFYMNPDIIEALRCKWIELIEDYDYEPECRVKLYLWAKSKKW